jgi:hypothetical protein
MLMFDIALEPRTLQIVANMFCINQLIRQLSLRCCMGILLLISIPQPLEHIIGLFHAFKGNNMLQIVNLSKSKLVKEDQMIFDAILSACKPILGYN